MAGKIIKAPRGTQDILGTDSYKWQFVERLALENAGLFGFSEMRTPTFEQMDLFTDYAARDAEREREQTELLRENKMQQAMLDIKKKFGKNAILKGMNLQDASTMKERNRQIGGHKSGE